MRNILKKSFLLFTICTVNLCNAQLKDYDLAIIKHYPPVAKKLINPRDFLYKSNDDIVLQYKLSEGDFYKTKVDSLAAIDRLDALDASNTVDNYTDGAMSAWVEGSFRVKNIIYILYGSYAGEGYLQGVLYDKNKNLYGLLEWESGNDIVVTLKTKKTTFNYNLSNGKKYLKPVAVPQNDGLADLLNKKNNSNVNTGEDGSGIGNSAPKVEKDVLYLSDLKNIESLSDVEKIKQFKKWRWNARVITGKSVDDNYIFATKSDYGMQVAIRSKSLEGETTYMYTLYHCNLGYVNKFILDANRKGYHIVEDRKTLFTLKSDKNVIIINKSSLEGNFQYFKIEMKTK